MFQELLPTPGAAAGSLDLMLGENGDLMPLVFIPVGLGYKAGVHIHSAWQ